MDHYLSLNSLEHPTRAKPHSCPLFGEESQDSRDDRRQAKRRVRNSKLKVVPSAQSTAGILWLQAPPALGHVTGEGVGVHGPRLPSLCPTGLLAPSHQSFPPGTLPFLHSGLCCPAPASNPARGSCQGNQVPCPGADTSPKPASRESGSPPDAGGVGCGCRQPVT